MHLLDVLVTRHAKWTAKRIRRGLFGQSLVDFSTESWSCIQLQESTPGNVCLEKRSQPKKTPRLLRSFAQSRIVSEKSKAQSLVPGMSQYSDDIDMNAGTAKDPASLSFSTGSANHKKVSQEFDGRSVTSDSEESMAGFS